MKIKILLNLPRTIDGKNIGPFKQGRECDLDDDTARKFITSAMAEEVLPVMIEASGDGAGETLPDMIAVHMIGEKEPRLIPRRTRKAE